MKTPAKNQKKQGPSDTHGSKATSVDKNNQSNSGKGPWKNPDPTNPKKSPEKINEPYAGTNPSLGKAPKTKPAPGTKKEKITNAGESEHHIPVNKSDYENFEEEYEDFDFEEEEEDEEEDDEDEKGETSSHYSYEDEEDESRFFRSQVKPSNLKKQEQNNLNQKEVHKNLENKKQSQFNAEFNKRINKNPQG